MDSFSVGKLKEISTYLQLIITALGCVDKESKINETTIYDVVSTLISSDDARVSDINGSLSEQIKALDETLSKINNNLDKQTELLERLEDSVGYQNGVGYLRIMQPVNLFWTYPEEE